MSTQNTPNELTSPFVEKRSAVRYLLPAPYTAVRVKREGRKRYSQLGHAHDISQTGMRFELDITLAPGELIEVTVELPGFLRRKIVATGRVMRFAETQHLGPVQMGIVFDRILEPTNLTDFESYVHGETRGLALAA